MIVDSGSEDRTVELIREFPNAECYTREFDNFANQCNFGLTAIDSEWVLSLDADYLVSERLMEEIQLSSIDADGFKAAFIYCILGRPLRGTLLPPRTILYRRDRARYENEGHGHRVEIDGKIAPLKEHLYHDDRKPLSRWIQSQERYAEIEAETLLSVSSAQLNGRDKIRKMLIIAPILVPLYCLLAKGLILDGKAGLHYVMQRTYAEILLSLRLLDKKLAGESRIPTL